jgi:hypothetical protein
LYVARATSVDCPLRVKILASAYAPADGVGCGVVLVCVVLVVLVVEVDAVLVVLVVAGGRVADPPITVAIGAHHPANASPHVTTTFPVLVAVLFPPALVETRAPDGLRVAQWRTNPVV